MFKWLTDSQITFCSYDHQVPNYNESPVLNRTGSEGCKDEREDEGEYKFPNRECDLQGLYRASSDWVLCPLRDLKTSHWIQFTTLLSGSVQYSQSCSLNLYSITVH